MSLIWSIPLTFAAAEWQAYRGLLRQGITSYYPHTLDDARRGRWAQPVGRPQFPGYLFAAVDAGESFEPIRKSVGIRDLLRQGQEVVLISDREMNSIKTICDERYNDSVPKRIDSAKWKPGDLISIPSGPFMGVPAIIKTIDKSRNVCATIGNLDVVFRIVAPCKSVRAIEPNGAGRSHHG